MKIRGLFVTVLFAALLGACGGGALTQLATGGIGGTGISTGSITAFGSIFVNGVEYDVDQATFTRNGIPASGQAEYFIGEYVTVQGTVNPDGVTGTAATVAFSNSLKGSVTSMSKDGTTLQVLGQTVRSNALTVFYGFTTLTELVNGNMLEISGVRDAQGVWVATSIRKLAESYASGETLEVKGTIQSIDTLNQTLQLAGLTVDYAQAALQGFTTVTPEVGQYIEAESLQALEGSRMLASKLELKNNDLQVSEGDEVEIEGVVTRFTSSSNFAVNGIAVITNASTAFEGGAASGLMLNALVEVDGRVNAQGVLVADEISIKESTSSQIDELDGTVSAINAEAKTFALSGQTITVDSSTIWEDESAYAVAQMNFSFLQVGDFLEVKTKTLSNGKLLALRVKREDDD